MDERMKLILGFLGDIARKGRKNSLKPDVLLKGGFNVRPSYNLHRCLDLEDLAA